MPPSATSGEFPRSTYIPPTSSSAPLHEEPSLYYPAYDYSTPAVGNKAASTLDEQYRAAKEYLTSTATNTSFNWNGVVGSADGYQSHNANYNQPQSAYYTTNDYGNGKFGTSATGNSNNLSFPDYGAFSSTAYANPTRQTSSNLSALNFDQIRIGERTMENVLKALDSDVPSGNDSLGGYGSSAANAVNGSRALNGLNLDTSFSLKKYSDYDFKPRKHSILDTSNLFNNDRSFAPSTNRSHIIKSHQAAKSNIATGFGGKATTVTFQQPAAQFFTSPDASLANLTLPTVDASLLLSEDLNTARKEASKLGATRSQGRGTINVEQEKELFLTFATQQYRALASLNPEALQQPQTIDELAGHEAFKYWGRLLVEDRERQARIILNLQKALAEALSVAASGGPNVLTHLGKAVSDHEPSAEDIGRYADRCRRRHQHIQSFFSRSYGSTL